MPNVTSLGTAHRRVRRLRQVVRVMVKYGFGRLFEQVRLWEDVNIQKRMLRRRDHEFSSMRAPERLRLALDNAGAADLGAAGDTITISGEDVEKLRGLGYVN